MACGDLRCPLADHAGPAEKEFSNREILWQIAKVAAPAYPMSMVKLCSGFVGVALVGRYCGVSELAAIGLAGLITNITGYSWLSGMSVAIQTKSSQDWGGRNYQAIGITLQRGYLILLVSCFPLLCVWMNAKSVLLALGQDAHVSALVAQYAAIRAPALVLMSAKIVIERTLFSIGRNNILLKVVTLVTLLNLLCNSLLIPRLGFVGAPLAMLICDTFDTCCTILVAFTDPDFRRCWPGFRREAFQGWLAFLRLSLPSFVLLVIDLWSWDIMGLLAGLISPVALATQAVVPRLALLQYVIGAALQQGVLTTVGNLLGEGRPLAARHAARLIGPLCSSAALLQVSLLFLCRESVSKLFTADPVVLASIQEMMPLCFAFSFFDAVQAALTGIVYATGKQWMVAPLVVVLYWVVGLPFGAYLAFRDSWGLVGLWSGYTFAVASQGLVYCVLVSGIDWPRLGREVRDRISQENADTAGESKRTPPLRTPEQILL